MRTSNNGSSALAAGTPISGAHRPVSDFTFTSLTGRPLVSRAAIELERCRIDAVAQSGRRRAILEYMPQVRIAVSAQHFCPAHEKAVIFLGHDVGLVDGLPE